MEEVGFYEAVVLNYHTTLLHIPRNCHLSTKRHEKLKSHELQILCLSSAENSGKLHSSAVLRGCVVFLRPPEMLQQFLERTHIFFLPHLPLFTVGTQFTFHTVWLKDPVNTLKPNFAINYITIFNI
jgi:hypothetical protein